MIIRGRVLNVAIAQNDRRCLYVLKKMITEIRPENRIVPLCYGEQLYDYLNKKGKFLSEPLPDIFFLYFNTSLTEHSEILKELRRNRQFKEIPTYILYGNLLKSEIKKTLTYLINGQPW
jgi:hypothetical protein